MQLARTCASVDWPRRRPRYILADGPINEAIGQRSQQTSNKLIILEKTVTLSSCDPDDSLSCPKYGYIHGMITSIRSIRRQELLEAALEVMKRDGFHAATVERVAKECGSSKGIVLHNFRDKQELILLTLRYAHALRRRDIVERLRKAKSPSERVWAILSVNLGETHLTHAHCNLWISFTAMALNDAQFARLQVVIRRRENSNLLNAFRQICSEAEAKRNTQGIMAMTQACRLWVGYIAGYDARQAMALMTKYLRSNVPILGQPFASSPQPA